MNLADLQKEAHAIAKEHGWWDEERTFGDCIALVHSELSEALEAYRVRELVEWTRPGYWPPHLDSPPKPMGVASELADVVIRVADMAEWYGVNLAAEIETLLRENDERRHAGRTFGDWVAALHVSLSFSLASREWDGFASAGFPSWDECLADCVAGIHRMAAHYGIDLDAAIEAKMEYNKSLWAGVLRSRETSME